MFGSGHEIGRVQHYTVPNTAKLVDADVNEPPWYRRVPGAVLYAEPGESLRIHVLNADLADCHSLHLHGVRFGIDSDGAWPLGVSTSHGQRSDEIEPGDSWTYNFDVTNDMIG